MIETTEQTREETRKTIGALLCVKRLGFFGFAGKANAETRREVLSLIEGKRLPLSKCGVTALWEGLERFAGLDHKGDCLAEKEKRILDFFRQP